MTGLVMLLALAAFAADEPMPGWARQAASTKPPEYPLTVSVAVLLQEEQISIENDGKRVMRERGVLKCVARNGKCGAAAVRSYNSRSGKIRDFRGWLLQASGKETRLGKESVSDHGYSENITEERYKRLDPGDAFGAGAVFAYEVTEEEKSVFTQTVYPFQGRAPVLVSRFVASLPAGWEVRGLILNAPGKPAEPAVSGSSYTWEMRDLPPIEREPASPSSWEIAPRLVLTFFPTASQNLRPLKDWAAVSRWIEELTAARSEVTPAIQAKATQLTANAKNDWEKIQAITSFVQKTKYVSVQMNLTRAGGYVPNKADQVLTRNYGDCKDKANLTKALLKAVGVEAYLAAIYSGARHYVRPEWPSPHQFNHMIVAIRAPESYQSPLVLEHAAMGKILFFDPTDPYTPLGGLDEDEQGSHALVIHESRGGLVQVPLLPAAANRVETQATAELRPDGTLKARLATSYYGQAASSMRSMQGRLTAEEMRKLVESSLTQRLGGLTLETHEPADRAAADQFDQNVAFSARQFGQMLQQQLLLVRPGTLLPANGRGFPAKERKLPVKLQAEVRRDSVTIAVPAGFSADEVPDAVKLESPYGTYAAQWRVAGGKVEFSQSLELRDVTAPVGEYGKVREFFDRIAGAESAPVVLVKK